MSRLDHQIKIEYWNIDQLRPDPDNDNVHREEQIDRIVLSMKAFGFYKQIIARADGLIIAGEGRWLAAKKLNLTLVPVEIRSDISMGEAIALRKADNETASMERDAAKTIKTFKSLQELGIPLELTGLPKMQLTKVEAHIRSLAPRPAPEQKTGDAPLDEEIPEDEDDCEDIDPKMLSGASLRFGDCAAKLPEIPDSSVDSLVTDPPAGIAFMNAEWDEDKGGRDEWIAWLTSVTKECLRVMKPGAHGLVWALPRTSHWTATALENAGFEIRDVVMHLFGSGFPKSLDVSKAIDRAAGVEIKYETYQRQGGGYDGTGKHYGQIKTESGVGMRPIASTDKAKHWDGWGTALKPAAEHWILIRKPLSEKTVAANVLKWGTGGINIDGCRIGSETIQIGGGGPGTGWGQKNAINETRTGRFPANLTLDPEAAKLLDEQSGILKQGGAQKGSVIKSTGNSLFNIGNDGVPRTAIIESGVYGASRFFYVAKPSRSEKEHGLSGEAQAVNDGRETPIDNPFQRGETERLNTHPTVKPIRLMKYFCRLVTPEGGTVLDPFMGSGTTGKAALLEGFKFIGIEKEPEFFRIARERIGLPEVVSKKYPKGKPDGKA